MKGKSSVSNSSSKLSRVRIDRALTILDAKPRTANLSNCDLNRCTIEQWQVIGESISKAHALEELILSGNMIFTSSYDTMQASVNAIARGRNIKKLDLSYNVSTMHTKNIWKAVGQILRSLPQLHTLSLCGNNIGKITSSLTPDSKSVLKEFSLALTVNPTLNCIDLSFNMMNKLSLAGWVSLLELASKNAQLHFLSLKDDEHQDNSNKLSTLRDDCASQFNQLNLMLDQRRAKLGVADITPEAQPWHVNSRIRTRINDLDHGQVYHILEVDEADVGMVLEHYQRHPVPGMDICNISTIYNPTMDKQFSSRLSMLQQRVNSDAFRPKWDQMNDADLRLHHDQLFHSIAPYRDTTAPAVKLAPLFHGTRRNVLGSIFKTGFANLAKTDTGFFGKGIYSAGEAEYSYRVYGNDGVLLLNWVSAYSALPVIYGDMPQLTSKANFENYDAHFVPVVPASNKPNEVNFYPASSGQDHKCTELVIFESSQCLPRFIIELKKSSIANAIKVHGLFQYSPTGLNFYDAAKYVYDNYLSKAYGLKEHNDKNWTTVDWEFRHDGAVIPRHNHGLAHTLRVMSYLPHIFDCYLQNNHGIAEHEVQALKNHLPWLQVVLCFFVVGRENEMGFQHDNNTYMNFRRSCVSAFESYVNSRGLVGTGEQMELYKQAIYDSYSNDGHLFVLIRLCHELDLLRCMKENLYTAKLDGIRYFVGHDNTDRLLDLAISCVRETGDRIMGREDLQKGYDGDLFVRCSQGIDFCFNAVRKGIKQWEEKHFPQKSLELSI